MLVELRHAVRFTLVAMLLFGGLYPVALWGLGRLAFPRQADGSLVYRPDGAAVGSRLIAQAFTSPAYFHPRPSAVDYNAASAGGSNDGPSNPALLETVRDRLRAEMVQDGVPSQQVPSEMVTASGSGLDPHIPPSAALLQLALVARVRGIDPSHVLALVRRHTEPPTLGFLGRSRVNVLELNLDLDQTFGIPGDATRDAR